MGRWGGRCVCIRGKSVGWVDEFRVGAFFSSFFFFLSSLGLAFMALVSGDVFRQVA